MKVLEIDTCQECPNFSYGPNTCGMVSDEDGDRHCPDSKTKIPDWCPLDTPSEYAEGNLDIDGEDV